VQQGLIILQQVHYDEKNVMKLNALLIGPEDTPYEYGMFEFLLTFPNGPSVTRPTLTRVDYPLKAPQYRSKRETC
jgi:ubiquitin-protein ligase